MKKTILSGMRPTGKLHIGHWMGALSNWTELQKEFDCYFMVADWHALMGEYKNSQSIRESIYDNVADWLCWGIDPEKAVIFCQSDVVEHLELYQVLSSMTPIGWLTRCPTYKDQLQQLKEKEINTHAFLGYPALQAADIALYQAEIVPVGEDQVPHLEFARELVRRFNGIVNDEVLTEPQPKLTPIARLLGLDGRKMSKSFGNCIYLDEETEDLKKKIMNMFTDPARLRKTDAGNPDVCNLLSNYKCFMPESEHAGIIEGCKGATRGCVDCKKLLLTSLETLIKEKREKKKEFLADKSKLDAILDAGKIKAQAKAKATMDRVKKSLGCFR